MEALALAQLQDELGWTLDQLAEALGISRQHAARLVRGSLQITPRMERDIETLAALSRLCSLWGVHAGRR